MPGGIKFFYEWSFTDFKLKYTNTDSTLTNWIPVFSILPCKLTVVKPNVTNIEVAAIRRDSKNSYDFSL